MITLGSGGENLTVNLFRDATFYVPLVSDTDWPAGAGIELRLYSDDGAVFVTWLAVVSGAAAVFGEPPEQVNAAIDAKVSAARLYYTIPDVPNIGWASGGVHVH